MLPRTADPIAAIATAPGRGAVGIVRVSGRSVQAIVDAVCGRALRPREATYLPFRAADGSPIDQGLAIHFPAPHSYTGEDVLELQAHGGPVVLQLLLARCLEAGTALGLRVAEPGEFTQRAFLNDKIDLAQAEAIADLIDASTEAAARSAGRSLAGAFSREIHQLRDALIQLRMLVEATLDFPEEEIDFLQKADAQGQLDRLQATLAGVLQRARQGALLREGIKVVIAGQPNAGKSSLLNALAGAELAIVTPIPGTTRDVVSQTIQVEGVPLHVIDTAGLRDSDDPVEKIGIERAWEQIRGADAVLFLHDLTRSGDAADGAADARLLATLREHLPAAVPVLQLWNKADAAPAAAVPAEGLRLSAKLGDGLQALRQRLLEVAGWQAAPEGVYIARARHLQALRRVDGHLMEAAAHLAGGGQALDLLAEELRLAQNALSEITGEFTADDLLGVIFSKFCIGK
ncbi:MULTISPECIES: tRNA uridine-5-carboxymethylaminomethyl(34) synthesis GTPase MnmE [Ramlibacter]|uniref:tRNA modification GTPase MnmE n=1 Tax=Ramlibacter pinisoli TaxID=2682844 RepID=A0A6N8J0G2_9BURK|nr:MULTISPECIES: tRNA uridine-5-carboxymethylaminomethyl(34) synthesis GTPase MnmE [Ramlibacter]MBA2962838.1 tRNA uridine-5-carboxymethylaminomethyl(34) synthesis GTPase MnmE [Ramlibacter sp. CGMCC 1.13660]MVQ32781.1 tRNA uridine-5-carboxymethylaminomethyl(34) synthesis GTPase MnmE [Ramlibacter pinisoli]